MALWKYYLIFNKIVQNPSVNPFFSFSLSSPSRINNHILWFLVLKADKKKMNLIFQSLGGIATMKSWVFINLNCLEKGAILSLLAISLTFLQRF